MAVEVAAAEETSMYLRVKGLHTSVADLRESCYLADVDDLESCVLQKFHCAAGRDDLPTELH